MILPITDWCRKTSGVDENLFVKQLYNKGFNENDIEDIIEIMESVCQKCWNANPICQCWNDE